MTDNLLSLSFKGERNYLHGTDIFNGLLELASISRVNADINNLDISFHHLASSALKVLPEATPTADTGKVIANFSYVSSGERHRYKVIETGDAINDRYSYPEDEIIAPAIVDMTSKEIRLLRPAEYTDIELWVALTKALHLRLLTHVQGKWLFVRGRFPRPLASNPGDEMKLNLAASFNDKLTRCEARIGDTKVGEIYFSVVGAQS